MYQRFFLVHWLYLVIFYWHKRADMNFVSSVGHCDQPWMLEHKISHRREWWPVQTLIMPAQTRLSSDSGRIGARTLIVEHLPEACVLSWLFCSDILNNWFAGYPAPWHSLMKDNIIDLFLFLKLQISGDSIINICMSHYKPRASPRALSFIDQRLTLSCSDNSRNTRWDNSRTMSPYRLERNCYCYYGYGDSDRQVDRDGCEMSVSLHPLHAAAHRR